MYLVLGRDIDIFITSIAGKCMSNVNNIGTEEVRSLEWKSFLLITVVLFPILSVGFVSGYGFIVWALQVFFLGPPGAHG